MLHLYYKPTCPFCQRVLGVAEQLELKPSLVDVSVSDEAKEELIKKGGKKQVPFLVDDERGVMMYESNDIIDYLKTHYGNGKSQEDVPNQVNVCPID